MDLKKLAVAFIVLPALVIVFLMSGGQVFKETAIEVGAEVIAESNLDKRRAPAETKYFSLVYGTDFITVTDGTLKPKWYNVEAQSEFIKGASVYDRAALIGEGGAIKDSEKTLREHFPEIYQIVKRVEHAVYRAPFDGDVVFNPSAKEKFTVTGARVGSKMNTSAVCTDILRVLTTRTYTEIAAPVTDIPHASAAAVVKKIGVRASYSTTFDAGNAPRARNIARSMACFNGLTVLPGEQLSFNKTVGARTTARGYEEANIIIDGEFVPGVGGGVCQTSTTLFNAAMLSGMHIAESHNHSLAISYVPVGRDAMVSSAVDLVLENNTGAPIYIEAGTQGNKTFAKFYGSRTEGLSYKPKTVVKEKPFITKLAEGAVEPKDLKTNADGYERVIVEKGVPARSAETYLEIYKGSKLINKKLIRKSNYKSVPEIIKYEKKAPPAPAPEHAQSDLLRKLMGLV
jgi:hypothetical protein